MLQCEKLPGQKKYILSAGKPNLRRLTVIDELHNRQRRNQHYARFSTGFRKNKQLKIASFLAMTAVL